MKSMTDLPPMDVVIQNGLHAPKINVLGHVNGLPFDSSLILTSSGDQTMNGSLSLSNWGGSNLLSYSLCCNICDHL